jgi:hypothetical protein
MLAAKEVFGAAESDPLDQVNSIVDQLNATKEKPLVEHFLAATPLDWRSNATFMYNSQSLQQASRKFPRAIAFSSNGELIMTFNGHEKQRGYHSVEFAVVRPKELRLEFREIQFCDSAKGPCKAKLSEANPPKCQGCHGENTHYIWEPYHTWAGAYGSENDILNVNDGSELRDFVAFKASMPEHKRYGLLEVSTSQPRAHPYREEPEGGLKLHHRANAQLTFVVIKQHARLLAAKIYDALKQSPTATTHLIQTLAGCTFSQMTMAYPEIKIAAEKVGLSFDKHWALVIDGTTFIDAQVLEYNDGLMQLPGLILGFLLPKIPAYHDILQGKSMTYLDMYSVERYVDSEVPTPKVKSLLTSLDALGPVYSRLGFFNFLAHADTPDKKIDRQALCAIGKSGLTATK